MEKSEIATRVKALSDSEKQPVLDLLLAGNARYTKNSNGYFFNVMQLDPEVVKRLHALVNRIVESRDNILRDNLFRDNLEQQCKRDACLSFQRMKKEEQMSFDNYIQIDRNRLSVIVTPVVLPSANYHPPVYPKNSVYARLDRQSKKSCTVYQSTSDTALTTVTDASTLPVYPQFDDIIQADIAHYKTILEQHSFTFHSICQLLYPEPYIKERDVCV